MYTMCNPDKNERFDPYKERVERSPDFKVELWMCPANKANTWRIKKESFD